MLQAHQQRVDEFTIPDGHRNKIECAERTIRMQCGFFWICLFIVIRCIASLMLMRMMTKMLRRFIRLMHTIGARHRPTKLDSESNNEHEDNFFKHTRVYITKAGACQAFNVVGEQ